MPPYYDGSHRPDKRPVHRSQVIGENGTTSWPPIMVSADHASYYNEITVFSEMAELCGSSPEHGPANVEQSCRHEDGAFLVSVTRGVLG